MVDDWSSAEDFFQKASRVGSSAGRDVFRSSGNHNLAAGVSTVGSEIDHVIGGLDHIEMVFDQKHRMAGIDETIQRVQQTLDVGEMQPRCRFVQDVDRVFAALDLAQFGRDLDTLRLAAGEGCCGLAQREISKAEIVQDFDLLADWGIRGKK